jgi:HEAT repeat protein
MGHTNMRVRKSAMHSGALLARLHPGQGQALANTVAAHLSAKHWQERASAASALGTWPSHGKTKELILALRKDKKGFVRSAAARALSTGQVRSDAVYAALAKSGSHEQESLEPVRLEVVRALHALGGQKAKTALQRIASEDPSERVQHLARDSK